MMPEILEDLKAFRDDWEDQDLKDEIDRRIIRPVEKLLVHIEAQAKQIIDLQHEIIRGSSEKDRKMDAKE